MKRIKLLLVFTLFITLFPMQAHASNVTFMDQMYSSVEKQIKEFASKINKSNVDDDAAWALVKHGVSSSSKLSANKNHALTATLWNSNMGQSLLIDSIFKGIDTLQNLSMDSIFLQGNALWDDDYYRFAAYPSSNWKNEKHIYSSDVIYVNKQNNYDNTLKWIGGNVALHVKIDKKKFTDSTIIYDLTCTFYDRFDFSTNTGSIPKDILSFLAIFSLKEFDWESKVTMTIEVPNQCDHQNHNYSFVYDSNQQTLSSLKSNEFKSNIIINVNESIFELNEAIHLKHDKEWVLELTVQNPTRITLSPTVKYSTSDYYIDLYKTANFFIQRLDKEDGTSFTHCNGLVVYKLFSFKKEQKYSLILRNELDGKGNNILYLDVYNHNLGKYVLENEPMDDYYKLVNGKFTESHSNSTDLNKVDLNIAYIGTNTSPIKSDVFELKVWENGINESTDTFIDQITKQATCTEKGSIKHTCERCGYSYTTSIKALGHSFSNYVDNGNGTSTSICDHCNETDTRIDILLGDVNSDGTVTALDRTILARYLAQWSGYDTINEINADVNSDGKVTALDRTILARHLAKWEGYDVLPKLE